MLTQRKLKNVSDDALFMAAAKLYCSIVPSAFPGEIELVKDLGNPDGLRALSISFTQFVGVLREELCEDLSETQS